jgi:DNA-binding MarR family transcriptional regulator
MLGDMADPRWLNERENRAWRQFLEMSAQVRGKVGGDLQRDTGLSAGDYEVLVNLSEADNGRLRACDLGLRIQWEKSRLSHHISRMEQRGLVRRVPCTTDNRSTWVTITAAGRRAIGKAAPRHVEHVRQAFFDVLTPEQIDALAEISEAVLANLGEECARVHDESA